MPIIGITASSILKSSAAMESIATFTGNGTSATYTFSSIPQTYKYLQLRVSGLRGSTSGEMRARFNGVTTTNYEFHNIASYNTIKTATAFTAQSYIQLASNSASRADMSTTIPSVSILDIANYNISSGRYPSFQAIGGIDQNVSTNSDINIIRGEHTLAGAVTSLTVYTTSNTFATGTTIALYGIKG